MVLEALMTPFGEAYRREMRNEMGRDPTSPYFLPETIDAFMAQARKPTEEHAVRELTGAPNFFIVSVDPGSDAGPSDTGIV